VRHIIVPLFFYIALRDKLSKCFDLLGFHRQKALSMYNFRKQSVAIFLQKKNGYDIMKGPNQT